LVEAGGGMTGYPRDLVGYGAHPPKVTWPGGARLALNLVLNYEEGGERCVLHGDGESEAFLSEMIGAEPRAGVRHMSMESLYEYGSRAGVWRVLRLVEQYGVPLTVFAVGMAAERHPEVMRAMVAAGHEIASHGYRWLDYQHVDEATETADLHRAVAAIEAAAGVRPQGWYTGRTGPNTRRIVATEGDFLYDADDYSDDLPFWTLVGGRPQLIVPYTLDTNDMRFATAQGFHTGEQFGRYLCDAFDALYEEGATAPRMLSVGLHCRLIGRPARIGGLRTFLDHVRAHPDVWVARRADIARHWRTHHPYEEASP
jgi:putative urate catabolism protein